MALGVLTLRAITSGSNLAEREGRERLFHRDKAYFESNGSQLRTYHAIKVFTEFDLQIVRDSSRKSSLAGDIGHHARAGPHATVSQRLLWPLDPSFGEAACGAAVQHGGDQHSRTTHHEKVADLVASGESQRLCVSSVALIVHQT